MKTTFGFKQFGSFNTPILAQKIGDLGLLCAGIAMAIWGIPIGLSEVGITGFVLPVFLVQVAKVCAGIGVFAKIVTKLMGKTTQDGQPITTDKQIELKAEQAK